MFHDDSVKIPVVDRGEGKVGLFFKMQKKVGQICLEFFLIFCLIFSLIFVIFNFQTLSSLILYHFRKSARNDFRALFDFDNNKEKLKDKDRIIIPKISVVAPIIFLENNNEKIIIENLKRGVVHFPQSKEPGEKGVSVLLGHSSRLIFQPGKYDIVFLFLSKLRPKDKIFVYFQEKKFTYKVIKESKIFSDLSPLNFNKERPTLYLVTCWPPGTNLKRLVVEAEEISH